MLRFGSIIRAKPGTVAALFAEGTFGLVVEVRDPKGYSGNDSNNLVRWQNGADTTVGFHPEQVEEVEVKDHHKILSIFKKYRDKEVSKEFLDASNRASAAESRRMRDNLVTELRNYPIEAVLRPQEKERNDGQ